MRGLLDLVYPPVCLACGARTASPDALVCPACAAGLDAADADEMHRAVAAGTSLGGAVARWRYRPDGPLAPVVHALKYGQRPRYGRLLGRSLHALPCPAADALVPMPLHRSRFLERGYNQSEEIAAGLAEGWGLPVRTGLLARAVATRTQTTQGRAGRAGNVQHAFVAAPADGLRLVLVDDVVTTGATARAAADALVAAGAAWVGLVAIGWTQ